MDYIITNRTQAISVMKSNYYRTKVYEMNNILYSTASPLSIIKQNCKLYSTELPVWNELVQRILGRNSKLPIPINPATGLFFVPTSSHRNEHCIWINYYKVAHYMERNNELLIVLHDGQTIPSPISYNQFKLQMKRMSVVIAYFYRLFLFYSHRQKNKQS